MPPLSRFKRLDVEPLLKQGEDARAAILKRIRGLSGDEGLLVRAPFLPAPLIEMLGGMGYASKVEPGGPGAWLVYFWIAEKP
jgi:hypothetical protein